MKLPLSLSENPELVSNYEGIVDSNNVEIIGGSEGLIFKEENLKEILNKVNNFDQNALDFVEYLMDNHWKRNPNTDNPNRWHSKLLNLYDQTIEDIYGLFNTPFSWIKEN